MAIIHQTTLTPSKLELLAAWLPKQPWYQGSAPDLRRAGGFRLDDPAGEVGIEFMAVIDGDTAYHVPMTYRAAPFDGAGLIGTAEHGVLGKRWIYDGAHDPVLMTQVVALLRGEVQPQAQRVSDTPDPTVHVQPVPGGDVEVHINRVLEPNSTGAVTGTWRLADDTEVRGVFITAMPGADG